LVGHGSGWINGKQVKRNDTVKFEELLISVHVTTLIVVQISIRKVLQNNINNRVTIYVIFECPSCFVTLYKLLNVTFVTYDLQQCPLCSWN